MIQLDRSKIPSSYREYLKILEEKGEVKTIDEEVDWNLEMGAFYRYTNENMLPAILFNKIKDSPEGFRAADFGMGKSSTPRKPWIRLAIMLGLPEDASLVEMLKAYTKALKTGKVHPPTILENKDAPCKENIMLGDDVDLFKFPAPMAHDGDGGRYIQTCGLNIVQTPDGKWTNWSTNRAMIINKNTMTGLWFPVQHNGLIHEMWKKEGKNTPWACALGVSPAVATQSGARCPDWVDEYDMSSKLLDRSIEMVKCETNDLMVPADAEIVIEGYVCHDQYESEGPFGEAHGYLADEFIRAPKQVVTAITYRNQPILPICIPGVPIDSGHVSMSFFRCADTLMMFEKHKLPVIDNMILFEAADFWHVIRVRDDWHKTTGLSVNDFIEKIVRTYYSEHVGASGKLIIVGEDIDPSDVNQVVWALATRHHPKLGTFFFEDIESLGGGIETYHPRSEYIEGKGGLGVYSCLPIQEQVSLPKKKVMTFEKNYPDPVRAEVLKKLKKL